MMSEEVVDYKIRLKTTNLDAELGEKNSTLIGAYEGLHSVLHVNGYATMIIPVESSNISHVGWWADENDDDPSEMFVVFKNGGIYGYLKVDEDKYLGFLNSESKGKYLNSQIKPNHEFVAYL